MPEQTNNFEANLYADYVAGKISIADLSGFIAKQPMVAQLYFLRGSEYAEDGQTELAMADFATAVLLEPEFKLARLQYCFCCMTPEWVSMVPVLLQPLLFAEDLYATYAQALLALMQQQTEHYDQLFSQLKQSDFPAAMLQNLQQLAEQLSDRTSQNNEISPVLLEIYSQKH
ncbi:MAG TPA: hypothetical protein DF774_08455 [Rheinheimera sp.]|uniref:hypothetical protein n=1 Tax=Rheinheimera sp. TaxID=1869214 RepID=UPI000EBA782B|nr:hypothetical protein [Rheinheimera sp.]HCU65776.1 hypothetical protein [Rheinheimera sp.]